MKKVKNAKRLFTIGIAALLVAALSVGLMIGSAADTGTLTAQSEYVCRIVSDDVTNTPPYASAGVTGGFGSRDSDGRVWVDKSVQANGASNAFDVTLSALAQEYSYSEKTIETIMEQNAADVLFVLDFSSSMTNSMDGSTRIKVLATSLNDAMKKIMDANPKNRIMAVAFDAGSYDFLPLGSYGPNTTTGNYVEYDSTTKGIKMCSGATKDGVAATYALPLGIGTHMQIGITYGCNSLIQSMNDGFGEGKRMPFVMVMTDGSSSYSNDNWAGYNLPNQNNQSNQIEANSTLAASFWKKRLIDAYAIKNAKNGFDDEVSAIWFNIGVGLGDPGDNADTAKRDQVSMKPEFASPNAKSGSTAKSIYDNILTRLEKAYNDPTYYVGDPLTGYDDLLARAGINVEALRTYVNAKVTDAENEFNEKLSDPNSDEAKAIKKAGEDAAKAITDAADKSNFSKINDYYTYIKNTYKIDHSKNPYKNAKNDDQYDADVKKKVDAAADKAKLNAEDAKKSELYNAAVGNVEEQAIEDAMKEQDLTIEDLTEAVQGYFETFIREYMGYDGDTQAERQSKYAANPKHNFAEYVNYADTAAKVEGSFDDLASLIAAATQGTVIPITHHSTTGVAEDEIFITFTDPIGEGTTIKTDADGNYIMSIVLNGVTYAGRPKDGAAEGVYEFYNSDKVLNSLATISATEVKWEINAYELPIIRFANRMLPGTEVNGKIYEDPNLAPIQVKYEVMPTAEALANTATNGNYIYEHDYEPSKTGYTPAKAVFTPTPANTYYFTNTGTEEEPVYEKVTDIEETISKKTNANKSETAAFSSDYAWSTDDDDDFVILLGNDARTKVLAEVSIEDNRPEDTDDYNAHEYFSDESITYTLKVKNLSDEQLKNLTYTLNITPSGPTTTDTPSALTINACSTEPDATSTDNKTLTWELDVLDPGETEINTVKVTPAKGTKNGTIVDAVITLTKVFNSELATTATDATGEIILAENATVNTYLDGTQKDIGTGTGAIPSSPSALYIKTDDGEYFALTKSATGTYSVSNIPLGEYTIYDGNSGTPNALGKVTVTKGGTNEGNIYWKTINMEKVWDDNDNQDGKRPSKVTFNLKKKTGESTTEDVASYDITGTTWKKSAVVLDKDVNGTAIEYVLTETAIEGYEATVDGFKVTNKHTPEKADVTMKKVWDDGSDQDGKRPSSVTFTLYKKVGTAAKTQVGDPYTFSGTGNEWTKTVSQLPVYEGGKTIVYSVEEANINVEGYTASTSTYDPLTIKNSYTPEETSITLKKVWDDGNDQDGIRPTSVDFILYKQTEDMNTPEPIDILSLSSADNWTMTVSGLPKNQSGKLITYTVDEETVPEGYTKSTNGLTVKNSYTPKTKSITVTKVWDDEDFVGKTGYTRPSVEIVLTAKVDNVKLDSLCKTATLTASNVNAENENEWLYTFTDLPVNSGGKEIAYTISETTLAAYKTPTIDNDNYKITNTPKDVSEAYNPLTIPLIKVDYHFTNAGLKDAVITATATGITIVSAPTDADGISSLTFEKPEYYSVVETTPPTGYMLNNAAYLVVVDKSFNSMAYDATSGKWVWTYDLVLDTTEQSAKLIGGKLRFQDRPIETSVVLKKVWDDNSDQDGKRPDSVKLTLYKTVNNVKTEVKDVTISKPATFSNTWTYTEEKLPTYEGGYPVTYTVEEKIANVDSNYTNTDSDLTDLIVTNKHEPETTSITLKKQWNDNSDQDGLRPDEITLRLNKTVGDKTEKVGDYTFSGEGDNWTKEITGLPVYEAGSKIKYTADEPTVPTGYEKATDGLAVRNSHTPEVTDVTVKKVWDDQNDVDEIRPEDVTLTLYKTVNGVTDKVGDITLDETDGSGNTWEWTEEELPVYEDGYKITYTVDELNVPTDYTKTIDGLTVKNSHGPVRNVYVTYSEGGSVSNGNAEIDFGGEYQTIATPDDGYVIDTVTINGVKVPRRDDGTYKIENITEDQYIVISFAEDSIGGGDDLDEGDGIPDKYQATVTYKVVNGTWADDGADPIKKVFDMATNTTGEWINVTPTPTLGTTVPTGMKPDEKHIANNAAWDKTCTSDVTVVDGSVYTYTFPEYLKHRIDISVTNGTKDITDDYVLVIHKDDQSMSFAPNTGYALDTVTVDGEPAVLNADGSYDFTTVVADHEIVVVYATDVIGGGDNLDESDGIPDKYQAIVTYKVVNGTWADGNDDDIDALFNTHVYQDGVWTALNPTLGTTVPTGMLPDDIHIAPGSWDKTTTSSVAVVDKDVFTFTFDQYLTFDITINVTGGTHDAGDDKISVIHKDSKTIQFTPDDGKVIKSVVIDGVEVAINDDLTYSFDNVSADHTITVVFADDENDNGVPDEFEADITYQVVNGTWEDTTTEDVTEHFILKELKDGFWVDTNATLGDTIPVGMLPDEFHLDDDSAWSSDIESTTPVTGNAIYVFNFGEEKYHNITIDITGGSTDPDEEIIPVKHKESQTVVITPDEDHVVDKIIIDGVEVEIPDDLTLKFDEVVDDIDIQIICEEDLNGDKIADKYQAEVTIVENKEAGDATGEGIFIKGDTVTVISTLNDGYQFIGWMVDGKIVSTDLEYSFPLNSDVKLIPIYEKIVIPETTTTTTKANEKPESPDTGDVAGRVAGILLAVSAAAWLLTSSKKKAE